MTDDDAKRLRAGIERVVRHAGEPGATVGTNGPMPEVIVPVFVEVQFLDAAVPDHDNLPELPQIKHLALNVLCGLDTPPGALIDALVEIGVLTGEWEKVVREDERDRVAALVTARYWSHEIPDYWEQPRILREVIRSGATS